MAASNVTLLCYTCGNALGLAIVPDVEQMKAMLPLEYRAIVSLLPAKVLDVSQLNGAKLPLLCVGCCAEKKINLEGVIAT